MASTHENSFKRVAVCSAIIAGFAYVGYKVFKQAYCLQPHGTIDSDDTEILTVNADGYAVYYPLHKSHVKEDIFKPERRLSVQERVRELNLQARLHDEIDCKFTRQPSPAKSFSSNYNSPRHSCSPCSEGSLSRRSSIGSPKLQRKGSLRSPAVTPNNNESLSRSSGLESPKLHYRDINRAIQQSFLNNRDSSPGNRPSNQILQRQDSEETLRKRVDSLYNKGRVVSPYEAKSLVMLLDTKDDELLLRTLTTITNCATFTVNQNFLREAGCLPKLTELIIRDNVSVQIMAGQAIANLAVNEENQLLLEDCIPGLINNILAENNLELLRLTSLRALTNLAVTNNFHGAYTQLVQGLYQMLDHSTDNMRIQALKLLVNLSCNPDMVPHLLAAKAPASLLDLLEPTASEALVQRMICLLANIMKTVRERHILPTSLPFEEKAASPETMYIAVFGMRRDPKLRARVFNLTSSSNEDIKTYALKAYSCFS